MEVDEAAAAAAAGAAVGEEGKLKETTVKDGGEGATESVGPKDADGVVMVLNEYRPGGHNGEGYTKGWYCDGAGCDFYSPEAEESSEVVKNRWHSEKLASDLCMDCAYKPAMVVWSAIRKRKASQSSNSANDAGEGAAAAAAAAKGSGGSKETPSKKKRAKVGEEEDGSGPGRTAYLMYRVDQQQDTPTLPATTIAKMWKTLDPDEKMYYMEAANRENTDGNPPPPESPSDEDGKDGPQTRGKGNAGAYSTGAAKYRKNRGKARIWSDEEVATYITGLRMHGRDMEAITEMLAPSKTETQIRGWWNNYRYKMYLDKYVEEFHKNSGTEAGVYGDPDERALQNLPGEPGEVYNDEDGEPMPWPDAARTEYCSFCCALELPSKLLSCNVCGNSGHQACLKYSDRLWANCKGAASWECMECKVCKVCKVAANAEKLMFCDWCDEARHVHCLKPPLKSVPESLESWKCYKCSELEDVELSTIVIPSEKKVVSAAAATAAAAAAAESAAAAAAASVFAEVSKKKGAPVPRANRKQVKLTHVETGAMHVFDSKAAACTFMGGSKTTMYRAFAGENNFVFKCWKIAEQHIGYGDGGGGAAASMD